MTVASFAEREQLYQRDLSCLPTGKRDLSHGTNYLHRQLNVILVLLLSGWFGCFLAAGDAGAVSKLSVSCIWVLSKADLLEL